MLATAGQSKAHVLICALTIINQMFMSNSDQSQINQMKDNYSATLHHRHSSQARKTLPANVNHISTPRLESQLYCIVLYCIFVYFKLDLAPAYDFASSSYSVLKVLYSSRQDRFGSIEIFACIGPSPCYTRRLEPIVSSSLHHPLW